MNITWEEFRSAMTDVVALVKAKHSSIGIETRKRGDVEVLSLFREFAVLNHRKSTIQILEQDSSNSNHKEGNNRKLPIIKSKTAILAPILRNNSSSDNNNTNEINKGGNVFVAENNIITKTVLFEQVDNNGSNDSNTGTSNDVSTTNPLVNQEISDIVKFGHFQNLFSIHASLHKQLRTQNNNEIKDYAHQVVSRLPSLLSNNTYNKHQNHHGHHHNDHYRQSNRKLSSSLLLQAHNNRNANNINKQRSLSFDMNVNNHMNQLTEEMRNAQRLEYEYDQNNQFKLNRNGNDTNDNIGESSEKLVGENIEDTMSTSSINSSSDEENEKNMTVKSMENIGKL